LYEVLLGNLKDARVHLQISFKMDSSFRDLAKRDPDLRRFTPCCSRRRYAGSATGDRASRKELDETELVPPDLRDAIQGRGIQERIAPLFQENSNALVNWARRCRSGKTVSRSSICTVAFAIASGNKSDRDTIVLAWSATKELAVLVCCMRFRKTKSKLIAAFQNFGRSLVRAERSTSPSRNWFHIPLDCARSMKR